MLARRETARTGSRPAGTCIGFDFGTRRIGTSVGETHPGIAQPLEVVPVRRGRADWSVVDRLVDTWQPVALVVGIPLLESGAEQPMSAASRGFGRALERRYRLPVYTVDEHLSSWSATRHWQRMRASGQRGRRARAGDLDTLAATLILQAWFDDPGAGPVPESGS